MIHKILHDMDLYFYLRQSRHVKWRHIFFFLSVKVQKKAKAVQTNMLAYVVWAIIFKSEVRSDLQGCLEAIVASKHHFLGWAPIDGSS